MARITGRFFWYDLMTTDTQAAIDFYSKITGWTTAPFEGGDKAYLMWVNGEAPIGGVTVLPDEAKQAGVPPHWLAYTEVLDVDETLTKANELGATAVVPPMDVPNVGRMSILTDPQGGHFAIFTPNEASTSAPSMTMTPGTFTWHELMTTNLTEAWDFYSRLFHWTHTEDMDMGPEMGTYKMFGLDKEHPLGGMMKKPEQVPVTSWLYYIHVPDLTEALGAVTANGGTVVNGPMDVPGGDVVAACIDPQGAGFALHGPGTTKS